MGHFKTRVATNRQTAVFWRRGLRASLSEEACGGSIPSGVGGAKLSALCIVASRTVRPRKRSAARSRPLAEGCNSRECARRRLLRSAAGRLRHFAPVRDRRAEALARLRPVWGVSSQAAARIRFARQARAVRRRPTRQHGRFAAGCSRPPCRRRRTSLGRSERIRFSGEPACPESESPLYEALFRTT